MVCEVFAAVASCAAKRFFSSVQRVGSPRAAIGMARSPVQSSMSARRAAASVISFPTISRTSIAVSSPSRSRASNVRITIGEVRPPGAVFHWRSPRTAATQGSTSGVTRKSGCSEKAPSRLRGTMRRSPTRRVSSSEASAITAGGGVTLGAPRQASTKEGAGAGSWV